MSDEALEMAVVALHNGIAEIDRLTKENEVLRVELSLSEDVIAEQRKNALADPRQHVAEAERNWIEWRRCEKKITELQAKLSKCEEYEKLWIAQNEDNSEENKQLIAVNHENFKKIVALEKKLARYEAGVEVEVAVDEWGNVALCMGTKIGIGEKARVLVMPKEDGK